MSKGWVMQELLVGVHPRRREEKRRFTAGRQPIRVLRVLMVISAGIIVCLSHVTHVENQHEKMSVRWIWLRLQITQEKMGAAIRWESKPPRRGKTACKWVMHLLASSHYSTRESAIFYSTFALWSHSPTQFLSPGMSGRPAYPNADYSIHPAQWLAWT